MIRYHDDARRLLKRLDLIRPHYRNPITEDIDDVNAHIDRVGIYAPILVSRRTGQILAGGGLYEALLSRGVAMAPVMEADDEDDEEALVMLISSYAIVQEAWLDPGLEMPLLKELAESKLGLFGTGYDETIFARREMEMEDEMARNGEGVPTITCPSCHALIEIDRMR